MKGPKAAVKHDTHMNDGVFGRLVDNHKRTVFGVAYAKLQNSHDAEDVMQDVFVESYRNFHKLKDSDKIGAWLYKATLYRCKDHVRKNSRRQNRERKFSESMAANLPPGFHSGAERRNVVIEAIGFLPEKYRQILMLKHFAGLSYAEISETTGLSMTTIGGRLQVARKKLREQLIDMEEGADFK